MLQVIGILRDGRLISKGSTTKVMDRRIQEEGDSTELSRVKLLSSWIKL